jgi:hypothetical protein
MKTIYKVIIFIVILLLIYYFNNKKEYLENNSICTKNEDCNSNFCAYIHPKTGKGVCKVSEGGQCVFGKDECYRSNCLNNICTV